MEWEWLLELQESPAQLALVLAKTEGVSWMMREVEASCTESMITALKEQVEERANVSSSSATWTVVGINIIVVARQLPATYVCNE